MSLCTLCGKTAGFFPKKISAQMVRNAVEAGSERDKKVLAALHAFWNIEAMKQVIESGVDEIVEKNVRFREDKLKKMEAAKFVEIVLRD